VRSLSLPDGFTLERLSRRRALTRALEALDGAAQDRPELLEGLDRFQEQAYAIVTSSRTREAFDIRREPGPVRDGYGRHTFGQSLLLARRLIEGGVRFVTVSFPVTWDTHDQNFKRLREQHLPWLDQGLNVAATFYHLLGIDHRQEYQTPTGRPVQIVRDGNVIGELVE
jgi:hypothetical protein